MSILSLVIFPAFVGIVAASLSTWLYWRFSPQDKLTELGGQVVEARIALKEFDGTDLRVVMSLTRQALAPLFRQFVLMLGPALLAVLPILAVAWLVEHRWSPTGDQPSAWVSVAAFWIALCLCGVVLRLYFKIK